MSTRQHPTDLELRQFARELYEDRCRRGELFDCRILGEPAWDMLLALYGCEASEAAPNVAWLARAARVPQSTGVRWQWLLIEEGFIEFGPLGAVLSTRAVKLTPKGRARMEQYLLQSFNRGQAPTRP